MAMVWLFVAHPLGKISNESYAKKTQHSVNYNVNENIWIDYIKENQIIFIGKIIEKKMSNLHIFDLKQNKKIFAEHAVIGDKTWTLNNITIIDQKDNSITNVNDMAIPNNVSIDLIKILAKQPKNHNIYQLKKVYDIQKQDQVVLRPYELELHKLLSNCANFILFALMAAIICFPINRYKTKTSIAAKVIMTSIILRFANNMFESLAHSGVLSVKLASWAVVAIMLCVATAMLIWKEA
jgi:lipopolysaccharide export LptBFGC system permease protein LptF